MTVDDEIDLLEPVFRAVDGQLNIVGHSWGGAVALKAGLKYRRKLKSLVLFEPALWSLLATDAPDSSALREIMQIRRNSARSMQQGDWSAAAQSFLDYWAEPETWQKMTERQREETVAGMRAVKNDWHGSFNDPTPLSVFSVIDAPVLMLTGSKSTDAAEFLARMLGSALKNAKVAEIDNAGHMGPVTHADQVNLQVEKFLRQTNGL